MSANAAAFFDLDRTLIPGSSAFPFAIAAWRAKMIATGDLVSDATNALTFRLSGASDERSEAVRDRILDAVKGGRQEDLLALNESIIPNILKNVRPEAYSLLEMHAEAGRDRYIISASPQELVAEVAHALGLEGGIGTQAAVVDGVYNGELAAPFCYGEGKADAISKLAAEHGYDLKLSYSYSDSVSDLPMMEMVGHPVAVNPESALESVAHQRGWPIVVFARKRKAAIKTTTAIAGAVAAASGTYALGRRHGRISAEAADGRRARG